MTQKHRLPEGVDENGRFVYETSVPDATVRHFRNVTGDLVKGALDAWAQLWEELRGEVAPGVMVLPEARKGFTPACGWPEFLEKMWVLRHYLDQGARVCDDTG